MQDMGARDVLSTRRIVNSFGAIGYSLLIIVYAIMAGVSILWLIQGGHLAVVGVPPEATDSTITSTLDQGTESPSIIMVVLTYVLTAFMSITAVFVAVTLPYWLGKVGSFITRRAIGLFGWKVTLWSLLFAKLIAVGIAAVPVFALIIQDVQNAIVLLAVSITVVAATVAFLLQHYLAKFSSIDVEQVW